MNSYTWIPKMFISLFLLFLFKETIDKTDSLQKKQTLIGYVIFTTLILWSWLQKKRQKTKNKRVVNSLKKLESCANLQVGLIPLKFVKSVIKFYKYETSN